MSNTQAREWNHTGLTIPAHVQDKDVKDFDFYFMDTRHSPAAFDVYDAYTKLHEGADIFYTPRNGGHWVLTRYDDMEAVYNDIEHFNSRSNMIPPAPEGGFAFLNYDGAKHFEFRKVLQPFFSPKAVAQFEPTVREVAATLISGLAGKGHCEFVSEFAKIMPTLLVMKFILQLPEKDTPYLMKFADDVAHAGNDAAAFHQAFAKIAEYIATNIIPARRAKPGSDILSAIIQSTPEGRPIRDEEILGTISVLIVGGLDTVTGALGMAAMHLAQNPQTRRQLIENPEGITAAADEMLRRYAIVNHARRVAKDIVFKGKQLLAGDMVLLPTTASALDETHFHNAQKVDFDRPANRKNLTFANGPHYCLGNMVARAEMAVFLSEWLKQIPDFEVAPGTTLKIMTGITNHLEALPLVWKVS